MEVQQGSMSCLAAVKTYRPISLMTQHKHQQERFGVFCTTFSLHSFFGGKTMIFAHLFESNAIFNKASVHKSWCGAATLAGYLLHWEMRPVFMCRNEVIHHRVVQKKRSTAETTQRPAPY